jgi:hypothetical protein
MVQNSFRGLFLQNYHNIPVPYIATSVADPYPNPDPPDPHVFGPPGNRSGSIRGMDPDPVPDPDPSIIKQK